MTAGLIRGRVVVAPPSSGGSSVDVVTTYDFSSDAGWTLEDGSVGGSVVITGGVARLTLPGATQGAWHGAVASKTAPRIWRAIPQGNVSIRCCIASLTGGTDHTRAAIFADHDSSITHTAQTMVDQNGVAYGQADDANNLANTSGSFALPLTGAGWLRLDIRDGRSVNYCGESEDSSEPTEWVFCGEGPMLTGIVPYRRMGIALAHYNTAAVGPSIDVTVFNVRRLT